ncbi:MAG: O-antigen ligase family protein [Anaerolineales bacterium]|nr:O-antigen ligase family protein [Anaerolineales bacterium]
MSTILEALPDRWRNPRTHKLLVRLVVIVITCALAVYFGRSPSARWLALPAMAVAAWLLLLNPHWGVPLIIISALVVPFAIGTGTGTSLNAPFLLVPALAGLWIVRMLMAGKLRLVPTGANAALLGLVITTSLALLIGYLPWNVFATLAPIRAQIGAWGVFVFSAVAFWVAANLTPNVRWLKVTVYTFIGLGGLFVASLRLPGWGAVNSLFVRGADGSLFWIWLTALAAGQALFNKQLNWRWRGLLALAAAATLIDRLLPQNREWASGWLPALLAFGIVAWLRWPRLTTGLGVVGALVVLVAFPTLRTALVSGNEYSLLTREAASRIILEIVRVSPIFGVGPANYYYYTPLYAILGWYVRFNSHNQYVDILAQTGLAGMFFLGWFALASARTGLALYRSTSDGFSQGFAAACLAGLAATLVSGMLGDWFLPFVYNIGIAGFRASVMAWLFLGGLAALAHLHRQGQLNPVERPRQA